MSETPRTSFAPRSGGESQLRFVQTGDKEASWELVAVVQASDNESLGQCFSPCVSRPISAPSPDFGSSHLHLGKIDIGESNQS